MLKKLLEEAGKFHFAKQESYSAADVENILTQHRGFVVAAANDPISKKFSLLEEEVKKLETTNKESADSLESFINENKDLKENLEKAQAELTPFKVESEKKSAEEVLKGLVIEGAEYDAYSILKEEINALEEKNADAVKPLVEKLFENKPYLKPVEVKPASDNKKIIVETDEHTDDKFVPEFNSNQRNRIRRDE